MKKCQKVQNKQKMPQLAKNAQMCYQLPEYESVKK